MTDYISREAVKQIIAAQCGECADACLEFDGIQPDCNQCLLGGAAKAIKSIPAADVRPVVNGTWKKEFRINACCEWYDCTCSRCWMTFKNFNPSKYCPNCGADMREANDV